MAPILFILIGAVLLVKGADLLVDGGSGIALKSGVSQLVVGLTVVAFGTSAPELAASLSAALRGSGDICFGNVIGSNVANIGLILGITALIRPVAVNRLLVRWELPFLAAISIYVYAIGVMQNAGRLHGAAMLILFAVYLLHCKNSPAVSMDVEDENADKTYTVLGIMVAAGVFGLAAGGWLFVEGAKEIARTLGVSESVIGLTVVALGTSLPELLTSAVAAVKGHADISLGNIVGSNIFNILLVLGATAVISPFPISPDPYLARVGLPLMLGLALVLFPFSISGNKISRFEGLLLFLSYCVYIALAVIMAR